MVISNHNSFRVLFDKISSVYFYFKKYINILALENGQPGKPALCQFYRRTFVRCYFVTSARTLRTVSCMHPCFIDGCVLRDGRPLCRSSSSSGGCTHSRPRRHSLTLLHSMNASAREVLRPNVRHLPSSRTPAPSPRKLCGTLPIDLNLTLNS